MWSLLGSVARRVVVWCVVCVVLGLAHRGDFTCSKFPSLSTGLSVMGSSTVTSGSRFIRVKRGSTFLSSGDAYVAGESLTVQLSSTSGEVILELSGGASFQSGSCSGGKRYYGGSRTLVMPSGSSLSNVEVWGAWATGYERVSLSSHFVLSAPGDPPTSNPTRSPTKNPTEPPTKVPTRSPTRIPTYTPTLTPTSASPTCLPTAPTHIPSSAPTSHPATSAPTFEGQTHIPTSLPTELPTTNPSAEPSISPSSLPSIIPSCVPTSSPITSSPTLIPTSAPSGIPSPHPTLYPSRDETSDSFSLTVNVVIGGVTLTELNDGGEALADTICGHLGHQSSLCIISFMGNAPPPPLLSSFATALGTASGGNVLFTVIINGFSSSANAQTADQALKSYLAAPSNATSSFLTDFASNSGVTLLSASHESSSVTDVTSIDVNDPNLGFSCDITSALRLSWEIESVGDGESVGSAGGSIQLSLHMSTSGGTMAWFGAGIVNHNELSMVSASSSVPNAVYLYIPSTQEVGEFTLDGYSASSINRDVRYRHDSGVVGIVTNSNGVTIHIRRSRLTGVDSDPGLNLDTANGFNTLMWAHGGVWPNQHSTKNRGFVDVRWASGECESVPEAEVVTGIIFIALFAVLLLFACLVVRLKSVVSESLFTRLSFFRNAIGLYIPLPCMPLEFIGLSVNSVLFCAGFLCIVLIFIVLTADFYEEEKGYDVDRAYASATGYASLFLTGVTTLPVSKTSLWLKLLHLPYDRATKFHRCCALLSVSMMMLHLLLSIKFWGASETLIFNLAEQVGTVYPAHGLLAVIFFCCMAVTASYPMRVMSYEIFQSAHIVCFLCGITFIMYHTQIGGAGIRILLGPLLLYAFDVLLRLYQQFMPVRVVKMDVPVPGYAVLTLVSDKINPDSVQPGNYCFLHVKEASGLFQYQWHPISISAFNKKTREMTFVVKNVGNWTSNLHRLVQNKKTITVRMYGPYGRLGIDLGLSSNRGKVDFNAVVLISGGIGITPMLSTADWIIEQMKRLTHRKTKKLYQLILIFVTRDIRMFQLFDHQFAHYSTPEVAGKNARVDLCLYCTAAEQLPKVSEQTTTVTSSTSRKSKKNKKQVHPGESASRSSAATTHQPAVTYGRPHFEDILTSIKKENDNSHRLAVMACGPVSMESSVQQACFRIQRKYGSESVALHLESFSL